MHRPWRRVKCSLSCFHGPVGLRRWRPDPLHNFPEMSGLSRAIIEGPTGNITSYCCGRDRLAWHRYPVWRKVVVGWRWTRAWFAPGMLIHAGLLLLAASRMALAVGAGAVLLLFFLFARRLVAGGVVAAVCISLAGYIALDPGLELADRAFGQVRHTFCEAKPARNYKH